MVASRVGGKRPHPPISRVATSTPHGISKRTMCRPTRRRFRGRLIRLGEKSEDDAQSLHRGSGGSTYTRKAHAIREAPWRGQGRPTGRPRGTGRASWGGGEVRSTDEAG